MCRCRNAAREFTSKDKSPYITCPIGTTYFSFNGHHIRMQIWIDYYHKRRICILCYNLSIEGLNVSDVIALKAFFSKKTREEIDGFKSFFSTSITGKDSPDNNCDSLLKLNHYLEKKIKQCLEKKKRQICKKTDESKDFIVPFDYSAIEINSVDGCDDVSDMDFRNNHKLELYGLLTGDEGFEYVPEELAIKRMEKPWQTRTFKYLFAFGNSAVMLNAKRYSEKGKEYVKLQQEITDKYHNKERNYYFEMTPCIACIDHCVLDLIEKNICIVFEAKFLRETLPSNDKKLERKRLELLEYVYHLAPTQIEEINELNKILAEAYGTNRVVEAISMRLKLCSEDSMHNKQTMMNMWVLTLTIATAAIGCLSVSSQSMLEEWFCSNNHCNGVTLTLSVIIIIAVLTIFALVNLLVFYFKKDLSPNLSHRLK